MPKYALKTQKYALKTIKKHTPGAISSSKSWGLVKN
jgi:hypothetical protein